MSLSELSLRASIRYLRSLWPRRSCFLNWSQLNKTLDLYSYEGSLRIDCQFYNLHLMFSWFQVSVMKGRWGPMSTSARANHDIPFPRMVHYSAVLNNKLVFRGRKVVYSTLKCDWTSFLSVLHSLVRSRSSSQLDNRSAGNTTAHTILCLMSTGTIEHHQWLSHWN